MKFTEEVIVLHSFSPGKGQYGKRYYVHVFQMLNNGKILVWSTTSEKERFTEGDIYTISFETNINPDGEINGKIQKVSTIDTY